MQMDSRLILAGRQPDVLGSYATGTEVGRRDALYDLYRDQGSGIAAGEQGALNALAQFDPQAALGVQRSRQVMSHADQANSRANQSQKWDAEKMDMLRQQARLSAADRVAGMKAEDRAVAMQELQGVLKGAATFYKQGDEAGYNQWLEKNGQDPAAYPFGAFPAHAAQLLGIMDVLQERQPDWVVIDGQLVDRNAAGGPAVADVQGLQEKGPEWRDATPDEMQRGIMQVNEETGAYKMMPSRMSLEADGKGGMKMVQGVGVGAGDSDSGAMQPSAPASMLSTIDGILNDPAFENSTGLLAPLQNVPGTSQRRFGSRVSQLDGQAFLQAFESLKGGGQITEIEGQKATQAIGRLDSYQRPEDYRAALQELRGLLVTAISRPQGWATQRVKDANTPEAGVTEDGYRFLGGDPGKAENWEKVE